MLLLPFQRTSPPSSIKKRELLPLNRASEFWNKVYLLERWHPYYPKPFLMVDLAFITFLIVCISNKRISYRVWIKLTFTLVMVMNKACVPESFLWQVNSYKHYMAIFTRVLKINGIWWHSVYEICSSRYSITPKINWNISSKN